MAVGGMFLLWSVSGIVVMEFWSSIPAGPKSLIVKKLVEGAYADYCSLKERILKMEDDYYCSSVPRFDYDVIYGMRHAVAEADVSYSLTLNSRNSDYYVWAEAFLGCLDGLPSWRRRICIADGHVVREYLDVDVHVFRNGFFVGESYFEKVLNKKYDVVRRKLLYLNNI